MRECLSVDYLQIFGLCIQFKENENYTFKKMQYSSRQFRFITEVYTWQDELFCTIQSHPFSKVMDLAAMIIKISNKQLYKPHYLSDFNIFCRSIGFVYKNISRIDICIDFLKFHNNLSPDNFIRKFMDNVYLKNGRAGYQLFGEQLVKHRFDYLRFGSNTSDVAAYLYNKSKEMRDVKQKNYILNKWTAAGYDNVDDVWRLEFSIKSSSVKMLNKSEGELFDIDLKYLESDSMIKELFKCLMIHYFRFKVNDNTQNKTRMKDVILFYNFIPQWSIYLYKPSTDTNKSDKIFIKKLHNLNNDLYEFPIEISQAAQIVKDYFINQKEMKIFYNTKVQGREVKNRK